MEANSGVIFPADSLRFVSVRDIVAHMAERGTLGRLAVSGGLQAVTGIPRKANVEPFLPLRGPVTILLGRLGLASEGRLGPGTENEFHEVFSSPVLRKGSASLQRSAFCPRQ